MQPHHEAWLRAHPERSKDWLDTMLAEGFDVHHIDGNKPNNDPLNLVLIEAVDHQRLHGARLKLRILGDKRKEMQRLGGRNRWKNLTPEQRSELARLMCRARWG